ncbi:MAG TPA: leader peptide processing enzyme [Treponema sp.]|nr:leader peptide processing enzyme [Treponema sp.]
MNKKVNTALFMLGATVFNLLITVGFFILFIIIYAKSIMPAVPEEGKAWGFPIAFIASLAISFFVYRFALKLFMKKVDVEKYFDPIFNRKR